MTNESENPSYEIARDKLHELFNAHNFRVSVSDPIGEVSYDNGAKGWPCIKWVVTIEDVPFEWRAGIGHVKWPTSKGNSKGPHYRFYKDNRAKKAGLTQRDQDYIEWGKPASFVGKEASARIACFLAMEQNVVPDAAEVLARCAEEGRSSDAEFEDWASEYGYDSDSIKAKAVYNACVDHGRKARRLLGKDYDAFADLANEL